VLLKWKKKMEICLISVHLLIYMDLSLTWAKCVNVNNLMIWLQN